MCADFFMMLNYYTYYFSYAVFRRSVYLAGFTARAAFQSVFFYVFVWSFVFSNDSWDLQSEFQSVIDNQDQTLYGSDIPFDLTFWQASVYHYVGMNEHNWFVFFRIFRQTIIDLWAGTTGVVFLGIPIWLIMVANAEKMYKFNETLNILLAYWLI